MVILKRYAERLRHRIQLEAVQVRQQYARHRDCIQRGLVACQLLPPAVRLDEAHIESRVVGDHDASFAKLHKFRKHFLDHRCVEHHIVIDPGQLFDPERNRLLRVDKCAEAVRDLPALYFYSADLDDPVFLR